jgi:ophiobolin F synthase
MTQLASVDGICAERVKSSWKEAFAIGSANKNKQFASLEEYVDFRVVDSAA